MTRQENIKYTVLSGLAVLPLAALISLGGCNKKAPAPAAPKAEKKVERPKPAQQAKTAVGQVYAKAERKDLLETVPAVGTFKARQTARIGAMVSGPLTAVYVDEGQRVRAGLPIARIDDEMYRLELQQRKADVESARAKISSSVQAIVSANQGVASARQSVTSARQGVASAREGVSGAKAQLAQAKAQEDNAALNLKRMKNLWENPTGEAPAIPRSRYDDAIFQHENARAAVAAAEAAVAAAQAREQEAQSRVEEAESRVQEAMNRVKEAEARKAESETGLVQAQAAVASANQKVSDTLIRAPFTGVVTKRFVDTGENIAAGPGSAVVELQEVDTLELEFSLPQSYLGQVKKGAAVSFSLENLPGETGGGVVEVVLPTADVNTRSILCRAVVKNPGGRYKPGLLAQVTLKLGERRGVLSIPRKALQQSQGAWQVMVKKKNETAPRMVKAGLIAGGDVEILEGLREGEEVLVSEQE